MARLGMRVAAFTYVGNDEWANVIRHRYAAEGIDTSALVTHPTGATSTTAVLIDPSGERTFVHCVGAPRMLDKEAMLGQLELFAKSRAMLIGYYPLMTRLQNDLPEVLAAIRETGCLTALDAAGDGGTMDPLAKILPHVDFYLPSESEAAHQTGLARATRDDRAFREAGAKGWVGIKLGSKGALLSPRPGRVCRGRARQGAGPGRRHHGGRRLFLGRRSNRGCCVACRPPMPAVWARRPAPAASRAWGRRPLSAGMMKRRGWRGLASRQNVAGFAAIRVPSRILANSRFLRPSFEKNPFAGGVLLANTWPCEPRMNGPIDAELLGRLLDEHGAALALYASQWTDSADDCVQEALVELARQRQAPDAHRRVAVSRGEESGTECGPRGPATSGA